METLPCAVASLAGALAAGALLYHVLSRLLRNLRLRMRFRRGARGECRAREYLQRHGFRVIHEQASLCPSILVDGRRVPFEIRADFIVGRWGRRAVVDAKTGSAAVDPLNPHTRRQLLEYAHFYDVDDVYLFDAEHRKLMRIGFGHRRHGYTGAFAVWFAGMALGGLGVYAWVLLR